MLLPRPWLSVLIPTLNGARFVANALSSIERERDAGVQCIVVDGGSRDATVAIVKSFCGRLDLILLDRPDSPGWVWSTNLALAHATAPHASLLHQDDEWLPGRAMKLRKMIAETTQAALFVHAIKYIDSRGRPVGRLTCPWPPSPPALPSREALPALIIQNFIAAPAPAFRTDLAIASGGLDEGLWYTADWDLWLKMATQGPVAYCPDQLASFRLHASSQSVQRSADPAEFLRQMDIVVDRHLSQVGDAGLRRSIGTLARFSNRLNAALALKSHGGAPDWQYLVREWFRMSPGEWLRFWRESRIAQRVCSRLRERMVTRSGASVSG